MLQNPHILLTFDKVNNPLRLPRKTTSECKKSGPNPQFFTLLTWKCASRRNGVHFFNISTSKSGPKPVCFVHFDVEMCFVPQRCATFHLSFGQMAPHPPLLARRLRTLRFSEPTFRPSEATNYWKNTVNRDEKRTCFSLFLFSDLLTSFLLLLDSSHLCFSICPYCRKFDF